MSPLTFKKAKELVDSHREKIRPGNPDLDPGECFFVSTVLAGLALVVYSAVDTYKKGTQPPLSGIHRVIAPTALILVITALAAGVLLIAVVCVNKAVHFLKKDFYDRLKSQCQSDAPLAGSKFKAMLGYWVSEDVKKALLNKMDMEQLGQARQILGSKHFARLCKQITPPTAPIQVWKTVDEILSKQTKETLHQAIDQIEKGAEGTDPHFKPFMNALDREIQLRHPAVYPEVQEKLWKLMPTLAKVTIEMKGHSSVVIKLGVAQTIRGAIDLYLAEPQLNEYRREVPDEQKKIPSHVKLPKELFESPKDANAFKRIFTLLNGEAYKVDFLEWLHDLQIAHKYFDQATLEKVEGQFDSLGINLVQCMGICGTYDAKGIQTPKLNQFRTRLEQLYLAQPRRKLEEDIEFAQAFSLVSILQQHAAHFQQEFIRFRRGLDLYNCYLAMTPERFDTLCDQQLVSSFNPSNLKSIYTKFNTIDSAAARKVVQACIAYGRTLHADTLVEIFGYQTPALKEFKARLV